MELSFPCAGNIDDGVFNIDLEEGGDDRGEGRQWRAPPPTCDSGKLLGPQQNCRSQVLSPDALDLALMAFDVTASEAEGGESGAAVGITRDSPLSPFCDAAIHQRDIAVTRRTRPDEAQNTPADCIGSGALWRATGTNNHCSTPSPGAVPMGWPSAKKAHRGELSKAFPLKLTTAVVGHDGPSNSGTCLAREHRIGEAWRRFPGHLPARRLITDVHAQSRWARERAQTREAVASSVRKEEKALAVVDRAAVECLNGANGGVKTTETNFADKKRVVFVDDAECGSLSLPSPGTLDATRGEDCQSEKSQTGAPAQGKENDESLARASELHSSVAGQLRSVNELLKRKSYFYIDTSWSARQLPYPPTAWKSPGLGGPTNDGHGEGVGIDANATCRITPSADRNQPAALSDANSVLRLDGRWVSAGSKKLKVGFYSIPGEKAHDPSWKSQDAGMAIAPFDRREKQALFAVFDGHGINGRQASRECMERLPKYLASASRSGDPASALRRSCQRLHRDLVTGVAGDCTRSGTTLCAAVLTGRRLTVANVGDSGCLRLSRAAEGSSCSSSSSSGRGFDAVAAAAAAAAAADAGVNASEIEADRGWRRRESVGGHETTAARELVVERVSRDHKPGCSGELERIKAAGGVVFPLPCRTGGGGMTSGGGTATAPPGPKYGEPPGGRDGATNVRDFGAGVPRVWKSGGGGPGLAMSRSIGDKMAHSVGVTHEPEIAEFDLDPRNDVMLVLATDGVWDVLSVEDIRKAAESHVAEEAWCPQALSLEICRKARSGWATATTGGSDDISCLVVKTSGILPTRRTSSPVASKTKNGKN